MNKTKFNLLLTGLLIFSTFLGCSSAVEERFDPLKTINLKPIDSLTFKSIVADTLHFEAPVDGEYISHQVQKVAGETYWVGLESEDYRMDIFSLTSGEVLRSIQFEYEGPNGVMGTMDGFFYHNHDSIFVLSIDANKVYLMNGNAEVSEVYDFNNRPLPDGYDNYSVYAHPGLQNGPFYVPSTKSLQLYVYRWESDADNDYNYPVFASFSIEEKEFLSLYGQHPPNYVKGVNFVFYDDPVLTIADTISYVQFGASEYLSAYSNVSGELLYLSQDHCEHWSNPPVALARNVEFQKESDWLVEQAAYPTLIHDADNKLIYRFLKHKQPLLNGQGMLNEAWFGPWCVGMYNYDLKRVGHYNLQKNAFLPVVSFAGASHLWIKNPVSTDNENIALFYKFLPGVDKKQN